MEMKHLYFKERPETLWREKERGYYKGKQVFLLESELYEGSTGMVVDEDLKVVEKYFEHSLDELEPDVFLIDDETYSEMEKARDLLCSLCYEVKCKDCQMVKLMAEAKETRGINKENRKPSKAKTTLHKRIEFSDWKRIFNQLRWDYGNIVILDVKKVHLKDEPSVEFCLDVKDEDGEERDFLLVPTEHGIFPVLRRDKRGGQHNE